MRITGGSEARRILKAPKGLAVRPTPDLVKQAVFNSLGPRVLDAYVLELFGGTGALSLESLSRGARHALCIEKSHRHAEVLRQNAIGAGFPAEKLQAITQDVFAALPAAAVAHAGRAGTLGADVARAEQLTRVLRAQIHRSTRRVENGLALLASIGATAI